MATDRKPKTTKADRDAAEIQALLKEGDQLGQALWKWIIERGPDVKEAAYLEDGLSMWLGALRGYFFLKMPRPKIVSHLRADNAKARALIKRLEG